MTLVEPGLLRRVFFGLRRSVHRSVTDRRQDHVANAIDKRDIVKGWGKRGVVWFDSTGRLQSRHIIRIIFFLEGCKDYPKRGLMVVRA